MREETGYQALDDQLEKLSALERAVPPAVAGKAAGQADPLLAARLKRLSRLQAVALTLIIAIACLLISLTALRLIRIPDQPPAPEIVVPSSTATPNLPAPNVTPKADATPQTIVLPPEAYEKSEEFFGLDRARNYLRQYAPANLDQLIRWQYHFGDADLRVPAVGTDGTVYAANGGTLFALSSDGEFRWSWRADSGNIGWPAASPDGGVLLAGEHGVLYALDGRGRLKWSFDAEGSWCGGPLVADNGQVYVKTRRPNHDDLGYIYLLSSGGRQRWRYSAPYEFDSRQLALGPDGAVYDLHHDGLLLRVNSQGRSSWRLDLGGGAKGPVFVPGAVVVSMRAPEGSEDFWQLSALEPLSGRELWNFPMPTQPSNAPLAGADGNVYVECYHGLAENKSAPWRSGIWAISKSGELLWQHDYMSLSRLELLGMHDGGIWARVGDGGFKLDRDGSPVLGLPEFDGWPELMGVGADGTVFGKRKGELFILRE